MTASLSCRLHRLWRLCEAEHSVCAHAHDRRHLAHWRAAVALLNAGGLVWHLCWDRRIVTDHVARSAAYYEK